LDGDDGSPWDISDYCWPVRMVRSAALQLDECHPVCIKFKVAVNQVHTDDKPSDCDWTRAPLGNKGCHFKAIVNTFNAAGESLGGDDAPKYRRDSKTGKAIVSYDRGKTWDSWEGPIPDMQVKSVEIWWDKVTENE
jgi:hypothetical protein